MGNLIINIFIAFMIYSWGHSNGQKLPDDLILTSKHYQAEKFRVEEKILRKEIEILEFRIRNELLTTPTDEQGREKLKELLKSKKESLDRNLYEAELNKKNLASESK